MQTTVPNKLHPDTQYLVKSSVSHEAPDRYDEAIIAGVVTVGALAITRKRNVLLTASFAIAVVQSVSFLKKTYFTNPMVLT